MNIFVCILQIIMNLYIFNGLICHQRSLADIENHHSSLSIINVRSTREFYYFMHYPPIAEHPNQRTVVEKRFYKNIDLDSI